MKRTAFLGWSLAIMLSFGATVGRAQQTPPDHGWNARMAALQEEHDAQAGVAVSIVFDDSGSMNDNQKLAMAKKAFRAWIEHAPESYRFGLVALNAGTLVPLQRNNRAQILAAVNQLAAAGGTPLAKTIAEAAAEIRQRRTAGATYERQVVVILTDGEDTSRRGTKGVQEEIRKLCAAGVEVVAFGYQGEGDYMRGSATHFYSPENEQDIGKGLNAIGSEIGDTSDVALDEETRTKMQSAAEVTAPPQTGLPSAPDATAAPKISGTPFTPDAAVAPSSAPAPLSTRTHHFSLRGWGWLVIVGVVILFSTRGKRR